jgi:hypothetical protein
MVHHVRHINVKLSRIVIKLQKREKNGVRNILVEFVLLVRRWIRNYFAKYMDVIIMTAKKKPYLHIIIVVNINVNMIIVESAHP